MRRKAFLLIGKIVLSGVLALTVLTVFCYFYSNPPVHYSDPDGATDYRWEPNKFRSEATEGFSWGRTNNEGYYNIADYNIEDDIDLLIMGSSQMEASNVAVEDSTASVLSSMLSNETVYNIGTSGHTFLTCANNLEKALEKYKPTRFVVIETNRLTFSDDELQQAIDGTVPEILSHTGGLVGLLQKNPFLRHIYHQMKNYLNKGQENDDVQAQETVAVKMPDDGELLQLLLEKIHSIAMNANTDAIIFYTPGIKVASDGALNMAGGAKLSQFRNACEASGIYFLDMSDRFLREYEESYTLPYGFANTSVGTGHLNKYGHAMIADELYKLLSEVA